jgi:hypothetical protein
MHSLGAFTPEAIADMTKRWTLPVMSFAATGQPDDVPMNRLSGPEGIFEGAHLSIPSASDGMFVLIKPATDATQGIHPGQFGRRAD